MLAALSLHQDITGQMAKTGLGEYVLRDRPLIVAKHPLSEVLVKSRILAGLDDAIMRLLLRLLEARTMHQELGPSDGGFGELYLWNFSTIVYIIARGNMATPSVDRLEDTAARLLFTSLTVSEKRWLPYVETLTSRAPNHQRRFFHHVIQGFILPLLVHSPDSLSITWLQDLYNQCDQARFNIVNPIDRFVLLCSMVIGHDASAAKSLEDGGATSALLLPLLRGQYDLLGRGVKPDAVHLAERFRACLSLKRRMYEAKRDVWGQGTQLSSTALLT